MGFISKEINERKNDQKIKILRVIHGQQDDYKMKSKLNEKSKKELITRVTSYYGIIQRLSQLYTKEKVERNYLKRRNEILESRVVYMKDVYEKKLGCNITFERIDAEMKRKIKLDKRKYIEFESDINKGDKQNGNAKEKRL